LSDDSVYFMDATSRRYGESWVDKIHRIFDVMGFTQNVETGEKIAIKMHMGEEGNVEYLPPPFARAVASYVKEAGGRPFLTDTTTLPYHPWTSRATGSNHLKTAAGNGFTPKTIGCPIVIADGEDGLDDCEVQIPEGHRLRRQYVAKGIVDADAMVVLTHFKGHGMSPGYSGSIKNVGVGCASKRGKYMIHASGGIQPVLNPERCKGKDCSYRRICEDCCPEQAVTVADRIMIDKQRCVFCFSCINLCANTGNFAIGFPPHYKEEEHTRIAESAYACLKGFKPGKVLFINVIKNVTAGCDCMPWAGIPKSPNLGITASRNIVAADQSSLDLIDQYSPEKTSGEDTDILIELKAATSLFERSRRYNLTRIEHLFTPTPLTEMGRIRRMYKKTHPVKGLSEFNYFSSK
jgi:uncharacterized Fe-S center protein